MIDNVKSLPVSRKSVTVLVGNDQKVYPEADGWAVIADRCLALMKGGECFMVLREWDRCGWTEEF